MNHDSVIQLLAFLCLTVLVCGAVSLLVWKFDHPRSAKRSASVPNCTHAYLPHLIGWGTKGTWTCEHCGDQQPMAYEKFRELFG